MSPETNVMHWRPYFVTLIERTSGQPARVCSMFAHALTMSAYLCGLIEDGDRSEPDRVGRRETTRQLSRRRGLGDERRRIEAGTPSKGGGEDVHGFLNLRTSPPYALDLPIRPSRPRRTSMGRGTRSDRPA